MKYIIVEHLGFGCDVPILFPDFIEHGIVASAFGGSNNVLAAGFVAISADSHGVTVETYGKSTNLPDKPPREEDDYLLGKVFNR